MSAPIDDRTMQRISAAIDRIGAFSSIAREAVAVTPLAGSSKASFALATPMGRFVLRLPKYEVEGYRNSVVEVAATRMANELGIGAEVVEAESATGMMLLRYVEGGTTLSATEFRRRPGMIVQAARLLARLHRSGRDLPRAFAPWSIIERYRRILAERGKTPPDFSPTLTARLAAMQAAPLRGGRALVPAHSDPVPANFIARDERLVLIDWEYAAMNDPAWDLAYLCVEAGFDSTEEAALLAGYGDASLAQSHLEEPKILVAAVGYLWGLASAESGDAPAEMRQWALDRRRLAETLAAA